MSKNISIIQYLFVRHYIYLFYWQMMKKPRRNIWNLRSRKQWYFGEKIAKWTIAFAQRSFWIEGWQNFKKKKEKKNIIAFWKTLSSTVEGDMHESWEHIHCHWSTSLRRSSASHNGGNIMHHIKLFMNNDIYNIFFKKKVHILIL